jgi:hypothetical protein
LERYARREVDPDQRDAMSHLERGCGLTFAPDAVEDCDQVYGS